jgi:hypothetical protein
VPTREEKELDDIRRGKAEFAARRLHEAGKRASRDRRRLKDYQFFHPLAAAAPDDTAGDAEDAADSIALEVLESTESAPNSSSVSSSICFEEQDPMAALASDEAEGRDGVADDEIMELEDLVEQLMTAFLHSGMPAVDEEVLRNAQLSHED